MAADAQRVLVVDDELNITELVAMALRYEGFGVETALTGRDALVKVESFKPALVILDVMLPDIDGLQVLRRLTAAGRKVPVIFLTARDSTEEKIHGLTIGGDDYVTKPFSLEELIARVRVVLRRHSNGASERGCSSPTSSWCSSVSSSPTSRPTSRCARTWSSAWTTSSATPVPMPLRCSTSQACLARAATTTVDRAGLRGTSRPEPTSRSSPRRPA